MKKINVFAVCKNERFVRALESFLECEGFGITAICQNLLYAVEEYLVCKPNTNIVLLDAYWDDYDVIHVKLIMQFVNMKNHQPRVIIMTNMYESQTITQLKELGVQGYFYKTSGKLDLIFDCIQSVYEGGIYFQECEFT